jgi:ElaB/YqjD/DUF883 family membrane-anchored ribosome-binding protein
MANVAKEAHDVKNKAQDLAHEGKDLVSAGVEKAKDLASAGVDKAKELGRAAMDRTEDAVSSVGSGIRTVGDTIERGGRYLEDRDLGGMASDLGSLIRRNPVPSILVGLCVGFLLARAFRS